MITPKVVSPPPPPTSNTLTYSQRARLMRTTKKLGQVLGSTPHLLDANCSRPSTPGSEDWSDVEDEWYRPASRGSNQSSSSRSPSSTGDSVMSGRISRSASISTRSTKTSSTHNEDSWSCNSTKPPLLRLALSSFSQRRRSSASNCPSSPTSSNTSDEEDARFTLPAHVEENPRDSLISPPFRIPSTNTIRMQKMDRIRKKLGDGVPVELVFPANDANEEKSPSSSRRSTVVHITTSFDTLTLTTLPPLPPIPPSARPRSSRSHYAGSRDSIVSTSAHRGPRVKRKPVPKLELTEHELNSSPVTPSLKSKNDRLSLILETPFELDLLVETQIPCSPKKTSEWFSEDESEQWVDYKTYLRMAQDT